MNNNEYKKINKLRISHNNIDQCSRPELKCLSSERSLTLRNVCRWSTQNIYTFALSVLDVYKC